MTSTLFDLDEVAPAKKPVERDVLAVEIADRASLSTKAISDAIRAWAHGDRALPDDPRFSGEFVDEYGLERWSVANLAQTDAGELLVRFTRPDTRGGGLDGHIVSAARWAADGSLVDYSGSRMIPTGLIPKATEEGGVFLGRGFNAMRLLGKLGAWGLFRSMDGDLSRESVALLRDVVEVPSRLLSSATPELPAETKRRLAALYLAHLGCEVERAQALPLTDESIFSKATMLHEMRVLRDSCHGRFDTPKPEDFSEDVATVLAPLLNLFTWTFETPEWAGSVETDLSSGWRADLTVTARHIPTGTVLQDVEVECLRSHKDEICAMFDPATRVGAVAEALAKELKRANTPVAQNVPSPAPGKKPRKAEALKRATPEQVAGLLQTITLLRPFANTPEQQAAISATEAVAADGKATGLAVTQADDTLSDGFGHLEKQVNAEAQTLLARRLWSSEDVASAKKLGALTEALCTAVPCYSESNRSIEEMVPSLTTSPSVAEVADGWWVSRDASGAMHGAVSGTGYYSMGSGVDLTDRKATVSHLLEEPAGVFNRFRHYLKSDSCSPEFAQWLKSLPYTPEQNAARRAGSLVAGCLQARAVLDNIGAVVGLLESPDATAEEAHRLARLMACSEITDDALEQAAGVARVLLEARFGAVHSTAQAEGGFFDEEEKDAEVPSEEDSEADGEEG